MLSSLADRVGSRPRRTLLLTLVFVLVAGVVGGPIAGSLKDSGGFAPPGADSQTAVAQIERATGVQPAPGVVLLVDAPASSARVAGVAQRLRGIDGVVRAGGDVARSTDGRRALVTATIRADVDDEAVGQRALDAFAADRDVTVGGPAIGNQQVGDTVGADLGRAEALAFPLLLLLSLLFFRGRAALLPLVVGVTTVLGTFLALTAINAVYGLNVFALNLVIGLGLGLAIDYTLFLVTRYREELSRQGATPQALRTTMRTAGRTVFFSATTVSAALITLTLFPQGFLKSMGIAGAVVAAVAALATLLVAPALLALWGAKLARRHTVADDGRWHRLAHAVMRRPGRVAVATMLVMLVVAAPALRVAWSPVDATAIPEGKSARTVADAIQADFGGTGETPITIAVTAGARDRAEVAAYAAAVGRVDGVRRVAAPRRLDATTWQVDAATGGDAAGPVARRAVEAIRATPTPLAAKVAGPAAEFEDQQQAIGSRLLGAGLLLAGLTFLVLWLMTGSVVLPLKAIVMNALTVGAALSPLVLIYQDGRLTGLLGYTPNGGVEPSDFLVTAALVFALSTDYGVFLLGRIKEARDAGADEREAVAVGLGRTGRVVTAAAILLAVAIGAFSTSSISFIQQIGVATATGVLVDAFVVRSLLVPSLMALLGRWNWWAPAPMRRLHDRVGLGEALEPQPGLA